MDAPQRAQEDVLMDVQHLVVDVQTVAFPVATHTCGSGCTTGAMTT